MKMKTIALIEESLKKKIAQMRPPVKLRMFKSFYSTFKKTIDSHGDFANK